MKTALEYFIRRPLVVYMKLRQKEQKHVSQDQMSSDTINCNLLSVNKYWTHRCANGPLCSKLHRTSTENLSTKHQCREHQKTGARQGTTAEDVGVEHMTKHQHRTSAENISVEREHRTSKQQLKTSMQNQQQKVEHQHRDRTWTQNISTKHQHRTDNQTKEHRTWEQDTNCGPDGQSLRSHETPEHQIPQILQRSHHPPTHQPSNQVEFYFILLCCSFIFDFIFKFNSWRQDILVVLILLFKFDFISYATFVIYTYTDSVWNSE